MKKIDHDTSSEDSTTFQTANQENDHQITVKQSFMNSSSLGRTNLEVILEEDE